MLYNRDELKRYIETHYAPVCPEQDMAAAPVCYAEKAEMQPESYGIFGAAPLPKQDVSPAGSAANGPLRREKRPRRLSALKYADAVPVFETDESFRDAVLRLMDAKGMTEPELYKKAEIDRKLFNKIKNEAGYRVGKKTAVSLAVALELPLGEARSLVERAGFSLSNSILADVIVMYFLERGEYDLAAINEALLGEDQQPLTNYS